MGHERADEDVADPDLVAPTGLEAPEGPLRRRGELAAGDARAQEVLAKGPLRERHPMGSKEDLGDLGSRAGRDGPAEHDGLGEQARADPRSSTVRALERAEP